ncbi:hypothetical protein Hanom_Chr08g00718051 [Helianthus anomalus]
MKDQGFMVGSNIDNNHLGFEPLGQTQTSSLGLCSSLWRNIQVNHLGQQNYHDHGMIMNTCHEVQQNQRLRSSYPVNFYHHDQTGPLIWGEMMWGGGGDFGGG